MSSMPESVFAKKPPRRVTYAVDEEHLKKVTAFKQETWELRDLAAPMASAFTPKIEELRHMIMTQKDLFDYVVAHPLHLSSVYDVPKLLDFIFHGEIMGCSPRLELVARLELPDMLLQLRAGLPAAHLGSDHLAIGAKYRFRD